MEAMKGLEQDHSWRLDGENCEPKEPATVSFRHSLQADFREFKRVFSFKTDRWLKAKWSSSTGSGVIRAWPNGTGCKKG